MVAKGDLKAEAVARKLIDKLVSKGLEVIGVDKVENHRGKNIKSLRELKEGEVQCVIAVGGDGTLLKSVRELTQDAPVLGVNVGGRGVLTEIDPDDDLDLVARLVEGDYILDRRIRIACSSASKVYPPALNEVYLIRVLLSSTPTYTAKIDGSTVFSQRMDGIVISTPTGSTGHSLSLGGPVIMENESSFLLTPIGAVSKIPPVVCGVKPIEITSNMAANLVVDGQESYVVEANTTIRASKHESDGVFIRFGASPLRQLKNLGFT